RERAPTQIRVFGQRLLLHQLTDRSEASVLQLTHVEMAARHAILRPAQEHVAGRLYHALAFDDPLTGVAFESRSKALEHGFARLLDLEEQGSAVAAHEQTHEA